MVGGAGVAERRVDRREGLLLVNVNVVALLLRRLQERDRGIEDRQPAVASIPITERELTQGNPSAMCDMRQVPRTKAPSRW